MPHVRSADPTAHGADATDAHVGRLRTVLRSLMRNASGRSAPAERSRQGDQPDRRPDTTTSGNLSSEQLSEHLVFLTTASRQDLDDLLTLLCVSAWPTRGAQMS
jgi:hypothetical protein